jgi:hypothetical protein
VLLRAECRRGSRGMGSAEDLILLGAAGNMSWPRGFSPSSLWPNFAGAHVRAWICVVMLVGDGGLALGR